MSVSRYYLRSLLVKVNRGPTEEEIAAEKRRAVEAKFEKWDRERRRRNAAAMDAAEGEARHNTARKINRAQARAAARLSVIEGGQK